MPYVSPHEPTGSKRDLLFQAQIGESMQWQLSDYRYQYPAFLRGEHRVMLMLTDHQ